ncbi:MAG TPA: P-II family nitrogen regulator [Gemmatimonadales bacterium]|jgi:nitrogen regulatory protein PII|nr:P-II family nitrogen regulator [Gemmatimonadales bacterium]
MKLILAIVKPFKVTELVDALHQSPGDPGMTVLGGRGYGRHTSATPASHADTGTDFSENAVVLVAAPQEQVDRLVDLITRVAHTGRPGDGKVFVLPITAAVALTTGEQGEAALG